MNTENFNTEQLERLTKLQEHIDQWREGSVKSLSPEEYLNNEIHAWQRARTEAHLPADTLGLSVATLYRIALPGRSFLGELSDSEYNRGNNVINIPGGVWQQGGSQSVLEWKAVGFVPNGDDVRDLRGTFPVTLLSEVLKLIHTAPDLNKFSPHEIEEEILARLDPTNMNLPPGLADFSHMNFLGDYTGLLPDRTSKVQLDPKTGKPLPLPMRLHHHRMYEVYLQEQFADELYKIAHARNSELYSVNYGQIQRMRLGFGQSAISDGLECDEMEVAIDGEKQIARLSPLWPMLLSYDSTSFHGGPPQHATPQGWIDRIDQAPVSEMDYNAGAIRPYSHHRIVIDPGLYKRGRASANRGLSKDPEYVRPSLPVEKTNELAIPPEVEKEWYEGWISRANNTLKIQPTHRITRDDIDLMLQLVEDQDSVHKLEHTLAERRKGLFKNQIVGAVADGAIVWGSGLPPGYAKIVALLGSSTSAYVADTKLQHGQKFVEVEAANMLTDVTESMADAMAEDRAGALIKELSHAIRMFSAGEQFISPRLEVFLSTIAVDAALLMQDHPAIAASYTALSITLTLLIEKLIRSGTPDTIQTNKEVSDRGSHPSKMVAKISTWYDEWIRNEAPYSVASFIKNFLPSIVANFPIRSEVATSALATGMNAAGTTQQLLEDTREKTDGHKARKALYDIASIPRHSLSPHQREAHGLYLEAVGNDPGHYIMPRPQPDTENTWVLASRMRILDDAAETVGLPRADSHSNQDTTPILLVDDLHVPIPNAGTTVAEHLTLTLRGGRIYPIEGSTHLLFQAIAGRLKVPRGATYIRHADGDVYPWGERLSDYIDLTLYDPSIDPDSPIVFPEGFNTREYLEYTKALTLTEIDQFSKFGTLHTHAQRARMHIACGLSRWYPEFGNVHPIVRGGPVQGGFEIAPRGNPLNEQDSTSYIHTAPRPELPVAAFFHVNVGNHRSGTPEYDQLVHLARFMEQTAREKNIIIAIGQHTGAQTLNRIFKAECPEILGESLSIRQRN